MCKVVNAGGPHPASQAHQRLSLCDLHYADYRRAKNRWKKARQEHREWNERADAERNQSTRYDPGDWETFARTIQWTRIDRVYVLTDPDTRAVLRDIADDLIRAREWMTRWAEHPRLWQRKSWEGFSSESVVFQKHLNDAVYALRRLGEEPDS